jgi:recombination protein RecR
MFSDRFDQLVQALRILPSVGPKSAQRMALHMIMKNREGAIGLAHALTEATNHIHECSVCHSLTVAPDNAHHWQHRATVRN